MICRIDDEDQDFSLDAVILQFQVLFKIFVGSGVRGN